jgi:hypothetical protein
VNAKAIAPQDFSAIPARRPDARRGCPRLLRSYLSAWYAGDGLADALTLAGLSVDGFIVSLGGQSLFGRWLFEDE